MNDKNEIAKKITSNLQELAKVMAKLTVGRSVPIHCHEIKVPEEVKQWLKKKDEDRNQV